jgi:hypothetical protein
VAEQINQLLEKTALQRLLAYQRDGNQALGVYNDKRSPTGVAQQFAYMLSYSKALPENLPDFYQYLLEQEACECRRYLLLGKGEIRIEADAAYRAVVTLHGNPGDPVAYAIAEKQLYSSHYFETALDLSFCVRGSNDPKQPGFYLITAMGSEQAGLTGAKGSIVRKAAVGRSVSNLQKALTTIRSTLEADQ